MLVILFAALVLFAGNIAWSIVAVLLLVAGMGIANAAFLSLFRFLSLGGRCAGWVGGIGVLAGLLFPPIMGAIAELGVIGYAWVFFGFVVLSFVNLLLFMGLRKNNNLEKLRFIFLFLSNSLPHFCFGELGSFWGNVRSGGGAVVHIEDSGQWIWLIADKLLWSSRPSTIKQDTESVVNGKILLSLL